MTKLYLVRHGETEWNVNNKVQGTMDTNLNERGLLQARKVADKLAKENISAIYTSSLTRAKTTALEISKRLNLQLKELHDAREICLGPWQGLTIEQIKEGYFDHFKVYREKPSEFNMPGAETFMQVAERFNSAMNNALEENKDKNIVIVSHGIAIKAAIIRALGMDIDYYNKFRIDNASITILNFSEKYYGGVVVKCLNDVCHLEDI